MPDKLHHNPDVTREIECKDCKAKLPWNDAVKADWVLGGCGGFRCKGCSGKFEEHLADIFAMRTPELKAWNAQNAHLKDAPDRYWWRR